MSAKDNLINVGLLAAGGVAIAAASGVYGKGSRAIRGMRYTLAYGGDNDSTIHVSGTFKPYSKAVDSAKKIAKRIGRTVEVREEGYDLVAFVEPSGRVDDGGYGKGSRSKMNTQGLISRLSQIPGVSRAFVSDTWHDGYNRITVVLKTQGTIPVTVEARGAHQNLHQISDYAKTAAAVRAAAKASGLFVEGVVGPKKIYEYVRPQYRRAGDKRESGFDGKEMYVEVYEGKGSMTRDGSYEATLMFDADEDDPARLAQQRLMNSPFAQQARPLTAEPPRITSAQGSAARRAGMAGMSASVEQDSLSGLWSVYLHDGRRIVNVTGDVFTTKSAAEREAKAMLAQAKAGVTIDALGSMFWEKHHKPRGSHSKSGSSSVLRGMTSKAGTPIPGPSLKTLDDRLNLGGEEGKSLRYFMTAGKRQAALDYANELLGGNGIEYIESQQDTMRHRNGLSYVNMGDTYDTTLIYDHKTGRFYVGAWGDWVERYPKRFG